MEVNINSLNGIQPLNHTEKNEESKETSLQQEQKESSSLDLQTSAMLGRSMVDIKTETPEQRKQRAIEDLKYFIQKDDLGRFKTPEPSVISTNMVEDILMLEPIAKKVKLDINTAKWFTRLRETYGYKLKAENIQRVAEVVGDINSDSTNLGYMNEIIKVMILSGGEEFEECNYWLHYISANINKDLKTLPNTKDILDAILFKNKSEYLEMNGQKEFEKLDFYKKLTQNPEILELIRNNEVNIDNGIQLKQKQDEKFEDDEFKEIDIYSDMPDDHLIECFLARDNNRTEIFATNTKEELLEKLDKVEKMKQTIEAKPELYLNGNDTNPRMIKARIQDFFEINSIPLLRLISALDKESINILMRKRLDDFDEYLQTIKEFSYKEMNLLKDLSNSVNLDGKPFLPIQKIDFIDLIEGYKKNKLDMSRMYDMLEKGKIDVGSLKIDLFNKIMKNAGLSDEEIASIPKEKLTAWDTKYAHLLAKSYDEADVYNEVNAQGIDDILRAANLYNFEEYINDVSNVYGKANANTKKMYKDMDMNYEKWVHPSKDLEIDFVSRDKNEEQLQQIIAQIEEDMNTLMQTPAKNHIKKLYPNFIKDNKFVIPYNYQKNKSKVFELLNSILDFADSGKMSVIWQRAINNMSESNPDKKRMAQSVMTIHQHLFQRIDDLNKMSNKKLEKNLNWKIKMWDRFPQKDLFQGNYSTCCIGLGRGNGLAMPHYLMNTAYNMIEIVDNDSGATVGNALCYFVKTDDGKPAFVLDNVEINTNEKPSDETGKVLRGKIFEYASKIAKEVTGKDDIPVFLSDQYNDIPFNDLPSHKENITFLGDIDCQNIYMDLFSKPAEWTDRDNFTQTCRVLTLK